MLLDFMRFLISQEVTKGTTVNPAPDANFKLHISPSQFVYKMMNSYNEGKRLPLSILKRTCGVCVYVCVFGTCVCECNIDSVCSVNES